jgi:hypothetical protein
MDSAGSGKCILLASFKGKVETKADCSTGRLRPDESGH